MSVHTLCYLPLDTIEGTSTDEEDVSRVNLYIILVRMLSSTLGRHIDVSTLEEFEQSLLYTLTAYITSDGGVVGLTGQLVDLIDKHDTPFCGLHVVVGHLQQTGENTLHILAHISGLSKHGSVDDGERNIEKTCDGTCQ